MNIASPMCTGVGKVNKLHMILRPFIAKYGSHGHRTSG